MLAHLRRSVALSALLVVTCLVYMFVQVGIGQLFFKHQADGSLTGYGSTALAQPWTGPKWFQGRNDSPNPELSGPANYGPHSVLLEKSVAARVAQLDKEGITPTNGLVTGSGSGLDPDIAPADAYAQVDAVAKANCLPDSVVKHLVDENVAPVYLGIFGAPYVNVLQLNVALAGLGGCQSTK